MLFIQYLTVASLFGQSLSGFNYFMGCSFNAYSDVMPNLLGTKVHFGVDVCWAEWDEGGRGR